MLKKSVVAGVVAGLVVVAAWVPVIEETLEAISKSTK